MMQSQIKVEVKWKGTKLCLLQLDNSTTVIELKRLIAKESNVEPQNQKLLLKGKILKDNENLANYELKDGDVIMMMGTPSGSIPQTESAALQIDEQINSTKTGSSTVSGKEVLRYEPNGLVNLGNTCYMNATIQSLCLIKELWTKLKEKEKISSILVQSLLSTQDQLRRSESAVVPLALLTSLHGKFPQFAQKSESGLPLQHDAEECWTLFLNELIQELPKSEELFSGQLKVLFKSEESGETFSQDETFLKLSCHINQNTTDLLGGLESGLTESMQRRSEKLNKDVEFIKTSKIAIFPKYLAINFVRFFWKVKEQVKAKILKKVKFPFELDLSKLAVDSSFKAEYDLVGVITHIGRSADSGHYMAWCKDTDTNTWWKFDDDKVSPISEEEIRKLDGGGDWHIAYICIYKKKDESI